MANEKTIKATLVHKTSGDPSKNGELVINESTDGAILKTKIEGVEKIIVDQESRDEIANIKEQLGINAETGEGDTILSRLTQLEEIPIEKGAGDKSIIQGYETIAEGANSHAEGYKTQSTGDQSHSGGNQSQTLSENAFAYGFGNIAGGRGFRITAQEPISNEDKTGKYTLTSVEGIQAGQGYSVRLDNGALYNSGTIDTVDSENNTVIVNNYDSNLELTIGEWNAPEGEDFTLDKAPVSENYFMIVGRPDLGDRTVAFNTIALGESNIATDRAAIALGRDNKAIGQYSVAVGRSNTAGYSCLVAGRGNTATGDYASAFGYQHVVSGKDGASAIGRGNKSTASASIALGFATKALASYALAEGCSTTANGVASHAEGQNTIADKEYAHAEGYSTLAQGTHSHSEGHRTKALGTASHAEGSETTAKGAYSHAEGIYSQANYNYSHAAGFSTMTTADYQTVVGKNNSGEGSALFIVGCGENGGAGRANCFTTGINASKEAYIKVGKTTLTESQLIKILNFIDKIADEEEV